MKTIQLKYALLGTSRSKENKENRYSRVQHVFPINTEMLTKMATITEKYFERSRSSSGSCDSVNKYGKLYGLSELCNGLPLPGYRY